MNGLPPGWAVAPIDAIAEVVRGVTYKKSEARSTPAFDYLPVLRATNIERRLLLDAQMVYVPSRIVRSAQRLQQGDVVIAASSGSLNVVGKSAQLERPWDGAFGAFCSVIRPSPHIARGYLGHFCVSPHTRKNWRARAQGTNINNLKSSDLSSTLVPIPPRAEQEYIVAAIDEQFSRLDSGVAVLARIRQNLKQMRAAVLEAVVTGTFMPEHPEASEARALLNDLLKARKEASAESRRRYVQPAAPFPSNNNLPRHWEWASLDMLSESADAITDGPFGSNLKSAHYTPSGPRVIRLQNIGNGEFLDAKAHISEEHFQRLVKHAVRPGDLVCVLLGDTLPRAAIIPDGLGPAIVKADCPRIRLSPLVNHRFVWAALNAPSIRREASARRHGVGRPRLNLKELRQIPIPLPPRAEQDLLVGAMDRHLEAITRIESDLSALRNLGEALRLSILVAAFSGQLVPQDPDDEPASVLLERIAAEHASPNGQKPTKARGQRRRKVTK